MKFAIYVPNFGEFGDARILADLAAEAEATGWDGFFIWDHIWPFESAQAPWPERLRRLERPDVVPDEEPVPTGGLRLGGEIRQDSRISELTEVGDIDRELHRPSPPTPLACTNSFWG